MSRPSILNVNAARGVAPADLQRPWRALNTAGMTSSAALPDANDYLHLLAKPASVPASGILVTPTLDPHAAVRFRFWQEGDDGSTSLWNIYGCTEVWAPDGNVLEWAGDLLVNLSAQAGAGVAPTGSRTMPAAARYCDVLTAVADYTRFGVDIDCEAAEAAANLTIEGGAYPFYILVGTIDGAGTDPTSIGAQFREQ